jgi:DNA gyrase subunit B
MTTPDELSHLSDREHVRERPGMYIGSTDEYGLGNLVKELISHSLNECDTGSATTVDIRLNKDDSFVVEDDGVGLPLAWLEGGASDHVGVEQTLQHAMTSFRPLDQVFPTSRWRTISGSDGIHVGPAVCNMLSEFCEVVVRAHGKAFRQTYRQGVPTEPITFLKGTRRSGFRTVLMPDRNIFSVRQPKIHLLRQWLKQMSFLIPGARIRLHDAQRDTVDEFFFPGGLLDYLEDLQQRRHPIHRNVIRVTDTVDDLPFDIVFQYAEDSQERVHSYVNRVASFGYLADPTDGGSHVRGFWRALIASLRRFRRTSLLRLDAALCAIRPVPDDFFEGLTAVLAPNGKSVIWASF